MFARLSRSQAFRYAAMPSFRNNGLAIVRRVRRSEVDHELSVPALLPRPAAKQQLLPQFAAEFIDEAPRREIEMLGKLGKRPYRHRTPLRYP